MPAMVRTTMGAAATACALVASVHGTAALFVPRQSPTATYHRPFRGRQQQLVMKRPPPSPVTAIPAGEEGSIPANLRRKVKAARPTLGHVVPKASRTRRHRQESAEGGTSDSPRLRPQGKRRDSGRYNNPSNLRIYGGSARGRRLESPDVYLRPMMGKVREAVYSTFTSFGLYDPGVAARQLDIFSGSGSVGLESLSRGASHCTFVDLSRDCCDACERNLVSLGFDDRGAVVQADVYKVLREPASTGIEAGTTYDIVTLCPPYEEIVYADLIDAVANSELVKDDTVVMVEYPVELGCLPHVIAREDGGALVGVRNRKYGRTVIAMYVVNPSGRMEVADSRPEEFVSL